MNALQGYNYATCQTDTRNIATYIDDHNINNTTKNNANIENIENNIQPLLTHTKTESSKTHTQDTIPFELINASLYIISGIYIIYIMDMFMRMGVSISH